MVLFTFIFNSVYNEYAENRGKIRLAFVPSPDADF